MAFLAFNEIVGAESLLTSFKLDISPWR